jgi:hypothetical protein
VSNDNPFPEAPFKTLKFRPDFPARFGSLHDARAHCADFFRWYNNEHHHSGIALMTPHVVHYGLTEQVQRDRRAALAAAHRAQPERFVHGHPEPPRLTTQAWINPPQRAAADSSHEMSYAGVSNSLTRSAAAGSAVRCMLLSCGSLGTPGQKSMQSSRKCLRPVSAETLDFKANDAKLGLNVTGGDQLKPVDLTVALVGQARLPEGNDPTCQHVRFYKRLNENRPVTALAEIPCGTVGRPVGASRVEKKNAARNKRLERSLKERSPSCRAIAAVECVVQHLTDGAHSDAGWDIHFHK